MEPTRELEAVEVGKGRLSTEFAPSERASDDGLKRDIASISLIPLMRELYDAVPDIVLVLNSNRQIVFANKALQDALHLKDPTVVHGLRPGEALGCIHSSKTAGGCGTTRDCARCGAVGSILSALAGKKAIEECRVLRSNGDPLDLKVVSSPFESDRGPFAILAVSLLADPYRDLFENATDLVFRIDLDGRLLSMNNAVERVFGIQKSDLGAKSIFDFVVPTDRERMRALIRQLEPGEAVGAHELQIVSGCEEAITLEINARVLPNGKMPGRVDCIARNITERKRAEAERRETQAQLLHSARLAGMAEAATSVLHNVGNVLTSVNVSATVIAERISQSEAANVGRVADLLKVHLADLGAFMSLDPRGKQIPSYLNALGDHLAKEQLALVEEVASLRRDVEHVKEIVARQQEYATARSVG